MYHRIGSGKYANSLERLRSHFMFLKEQYPLVLPGDPLAQGKLSLCLTFDDATYDFYHYIFPLLKELNVRVLLGVPVSYIQDTTNLSSEERLSVPYPLLMQEGFYDQKVPFCTWEELREMVRSGLVEMASHSYLHCNLTLDFVDLNREVVLSKEILEQKLSQPVTSFIYPFGKVTLALHEYVSQHYPYAFRIGSALNWGWGKNKKPLNRVPADNMPSSTGLVSYPKLAAYLVKALFC